MKEKNEVFNSIRTAKKNLDALADDVVKAESAVSIAQEIMEKEEHDDGVASPEDIFERSEAARRELSIRKIQANRATAKLTEAETKFRVLILASTDLIHDLLVKKADEYYSQLRAKIAPLVGEAAAASNEFNLLIRKSEVFRTRMAQTNLICTAKIKSTMECAATPELVDAILDSEPLL